MTKTDIMDRHSLRIRGDCKRRDDVRKSSDTGDALRLG